MSSKILSFYQAFQKKTFETILINLPSISGIKLLSAIWRQNGGRSKNKKKVRLNDEITKIQFFTASG